MYVWCMKIRKIYIEDDDFLVEGVLRFQNRPALLKNIANTLVNCKNREIFRIMPSPKPFDHTRFYHFKKQRPEHHPKKSQTKISVATR